MTFLYPLGLLGLIGVPVLIIVYILKNRYTEQTVASTYLWTLSERFLKRRNPLSKITGIISLILQILLIIALSLAVAHPKIILKNAAREYCFVLDGSASMNMETEGVSRFDTAKVEIVKIVDEAENGSAFSLVFVADTTETVVNLETDKSEFKKQLNSLECKGSTADYTDSIGIAQKYFNDNPSVITYLVTDTDFTEHENVEIINVTGNEVNASVYDITYEELGGNAYCVSGKAISYGGNVVTDIEVRNNVEDVILGTQKLQLISGVETSFAINIETGDFYSLRVNLTANDAMALDNFATVYNIKSENSYKALLVSEAPFLLKSALDTVSNAEIEVISPADYKAMEDSLSLEDKNVTGYGLYIFDGYSPEASPADGTVWFVGPTANIENAGFSVQGTVELDEGVTLELNKSSNSVMRRLTTGLIGEGIYIKKFTKCGVYGNFSTIYSYMSNPVVFTGETDNGNRQVVFAFNIHDTNFVLTSDYPVLLYNLLNYSFPSVVEKTEYYSGDTAEINVISGCTAIRVEQPNGEAFYAETGSAVSEFPLSQVGEYKITLETSSGERVFYIYSSVPTGESCTLSEQQEMYSIRGEAENNGIDGEYDPMILLFVLAAVFFTAEWMVYCYEKYQLR